MKDYREIKERVHSFNVHKVFVKMPQRKYVSKSSFFFLFSRALSFGIINNELFSIMDIRFARFVY